LISTLVEIRDVENETVFIRREKVLKKIRITPHVTVYGVRLSHKRLALT